MSEKDFAQLMKNSNLKINSSFGDNLSPEVNHLLNSHKIEIKNPDLKNIKKTGGNVDFDKVCDSIINSDIDFFYDEKSLLVIFNNARVLSLNQMFTLYQMTSPKTNKKPIPFKMIKYKSIWEKKMELVGEKLIIDSLEKNKLLPRFDKPVKIYLYRQSQKLIDEDNYSASFKYIIDGLRKEYQILGKSYRIIYDDNQNYLSSIVSCQVKNKNNIIAIKIVLDNDYKSICDIESLKIAN